MGHPTLFFPCTGTLLVEATAVGEGRFLHRIVREVEDARALKPDFLHLVVWVLRIYTPTVVVVAGLALVGWMVGSWLATGQIEPPAGIVLELSGTSSYIHPWNTGGGMTDVAEPMPITGDITASSDVTVNTKGGSMTATLRKPLRDLLPDKMGHLSGAALTFEGGAAVVLLAGGNEGDATPAGVQVRRVSRNLFEIEMETEDGKSEEVDVVTEAFLTLKERQLARGMLRLSDPMSAEDWRAKTDAELAEARELLASAAHDGR